MIEIRPSYNDGVADKSTDNMDYYTLIMLLGVDCHTINDDVLSMMMLDIIMMLPLNSNYINCVDDYEDDEVSVWAISAANYK